MSAAARAVLLGLSGLVLVAATSLPTASAASAASAGVPGRAIAHAALVPFAPAAGERHADRAAAPDHSHAGNSDAVDITDGARTALVLVAAGEHRTDAMHTRIRGGAAPARAPPAEGSA